MNSNKESPNGSPTRRPHSSLSTASNLSTTSSRSLSKSPCKQCLILDQKTSGVGNKSLSSSTCTSSKKLHFKHHQTRDVSDASISERKTSLFGDKSAQMLFKISAPTQTSVTSTKTTTTTTSPMIASSTYDDDSHDLNENITRMQQPTNSMSPHEKKDDAADTSSISSTIFLVFLLILGVIFSIVQVVQPTVFIDEFFHVGQSREYCLNNNFTHWDNKITTPPGLYLASYVLLKPLEALKSAYKLSSSWLDPCSITQLRLTNVFFTLGNFWCLTKIFQSNSATRSGAQALGLTLAIFPPLFFPFTFLYYTDVGSLFSILLLLQTRQNILVVFFGLFSLLFRQTNIVWIFFIAALCALQELFRSIEDVVHFYRHEFVLGGFRSCFFKPQDRKFTNPKYLAQFGLHFVWKIFTKFWGFLVCALAFVAFLIVNKGIVLGDRSAHEASFHLAQVSYFLTFCGIFALPVLVNTRRLLRFVDFVRNHPFAAVGLLSFIALSLSSKFTFVHPYLLADNRHYTFYLWKKLWNRSQMVRFAPVPLYGYVAFTMFDMFQVPSVLVKFNSPLVKYEQLASKVLYVAVVLVTIVPQQLIEFRYFITPYFFWRLNTREGFSYRELLYFVLVNLVTVSLFVGRTIEYSADEPKQRIIW